MQWAVGFGEAKQQTTGTVFVGGVVLDDHRAGAGFADFAVCDVALYHAFERVLRKFELTGDKLRAQNGKSFPSTEYPSKFFRLYPVAHGCLMVARVCWRQFGETSVIQVTLHIIYRAIALIGVG